MAGLSGVVHVMRPGRARCVVLFRRCRGRQLSARQGLCGVLYGPQWLCLVVVAVPYVICFPLGVFFLLVVCPISGRPRVWLLYCCQYFGWYAVVFAAQWSACPAVGWVGPWWPCRVGAGCFSCVRPVWYVLTVRRPLMVERVLRGRKVVTIGTTAEENFEIRYHMPCPALEASLHAQSHLVFRSALWLSFQLRLYGSYAHPCRWQGPFSPPRCISVLPMGAPGCCACSVVPCSCLCLAGPVVCVSVPQCSFRRLEWPGSCYGVGASRLTWRAGLAATLPCSPAGAGGLVGPAQ